VNACITPDGIDTEGEKLLHSLKQDLPALEGLLAEVDGHWGFEDSFYRFYHQSFKVYGLQSLTERIVESLRRHDQGKELNAWFLEIVARGTGKVFDNGVNRDWTNQTAPILEAFFHARAFLSFAVRYARELDHAPRLLPSGWAAVLYLYNIR
jgi:hypothetical protein